LFLILTNVYHVTIKKKKKKTMFSMYINVV